MAKVFFSYSHDDETHRDQLEKHLSALKYEGLIESWHDRRLLAGAYVNAEIDRQLEEADVVLLLVSASFLASNYCYGIEMTRAMQRHQDGMCKVIPVIFRPCEWMKTPLGKLLAAPRDGKAITLWSNYDEALTDVVTQVRRVLEGVQSKAGKAAAAIPSNFLVGTLPPYIGNAALPRSSNLRLRNQFTDADKDKYLLETFDYLAEFFNGSLQELESRHTKVEGRYRRIDANTFTATIYRAGQKVAECAIRVGGLFGQHSLSYSTDAAGCSNSANDLLSIGNDDIALHWTVSFCGSGTNEKAKMSKEQAAEHFWGVLIRPIQ